KIVFVPGYDITLAKRLVQGVDVWMNNPTRPLEASGTSGEKASMNGVMHFSVLDGWWVEGYQKDAGWALPLERTYDDQNYQNELDAATIYATIENEIAPDYYDVDKQSGLPVKWIGYIKNTIAKVASNFTTNRMLTDYCNQYYIPQSARFGKLAADNSALAREIAEWKHFMAEEWNNMRIVSYTQPSASYVLSQESPLVSEVVIDMGRIKPEFIGVEMLFTSTDAKGGQHIQEVAPFELVSFENGIATFRATVLPERTGMYQVGTRIYPKNDQLPHRQDFPVVKWL
ncbi:MAG: alpha-glucan family phosphorylase, partial [Bacteroidales bacterium]|nr:alpha-glucan family phosphorylase [Bacteroidales bacterium]